ncbi:hypothetical protein P8605_27945, partial [Streptomyces sp. T-3]|nr:hypothetical protein [Streptomyces sp. T-3]
PTPPPGTAPPRRLRPPLLAALVAFALLLVGGGTWLGVSVLGGEDRPKSGSGKQSSSRPADPDAGFPYGKDVALTSELGAGQCLSAIWSGKKFQGPPELTEVTCDDDHQAQIMALVEADSFEQARKQAAGKCSAKLSRLRAALPGSTVYPLLPTRGTVDANSGRATVPCAMFIESSGLYGDLGAFRKEGVEIYLGNTGTGDCFDVKGEEAWILTDCDKPHQQQAVGWVAAPKHMTYARWEAEVGDLCTNRFGSAWVRDDAHEIYSWYAVEKDFDGGDRYAVCALHRVDNKKLPAGPAEPVTGS